MAITNPINEVELKLVTITSHSEYQRFGMFNSFANELHTYIAPRYRHFRNYVYAACDIEVRPEWPNEQRPLIVAFRITIWPAHKVAINDSLKLGLSRVWHIGDIEAILSLHHAYREQQYAEFWNRHIIDSLFKLGAEQSIREGQQ